MAPSQALAGGKNMRRSTYFGIFEIILFFAVIYSTSCGVNVIKTKVLCSNEPLTETEITDLGNQELDKFCARQEIDRNIFHSPPRLKFIDREKIWVVDYHGGEYTIRFIIDNCGSIETSYGPRERIIKIE
jgi:hypothetical protein